MFHYGICDIISAVDCYIKIFLQNNCDRTQPNSFDFNELYLTKHYYSHTTQPSYSSQGNWQNLSLTALCLQAW